MLAALGVGAFAVARFSSDESDECGPSLYCPEALNAFFSETQSDDGATNLKKLTEEARQGLSFYNGEAQWSDDPLPEWWSAPPDPRVCVPRNYDYLQLQRVNDTDYLRLDAVKSNCSSLTMEECVAEDVAAYFLPGAPNADHSTLAAFFNQFKDPEKLYFDKLSQCAVRSGVVLLDFWVAYLCAAGATTPWDCNTEAQAFGSFCVAQAFGSFDKSRSDVYCSSGTGECDDWQNATALLENQTAFLEKAVACQIDEGECIQTCPALDVTRRRLSTVENLPIYYDSLLGRNWETPVVCLGSIGGICAWTLNPHDRRLIMGGDPLTLDTLNRGASSAVNNDTLRAEGGQLSQTAHVGMRMLRFFLFLGLLAKEIDIGRDPGRISVEEALWNSLLTGEVICFLHYFDYDENDLIEEWELNELIAIAVEEVADVDGRRVEEVANNSRALVLLGAPFRTFICAPDALGGLEWDSCRTGLRNVTLSNGRDVVRRVVQVLSLPDLSVLQNLSVDSVVTELGTANRTQLQPSNWVTRSKNALWSRIASTFSALFQHPEQVAFGMPLLQTMIQFASNFVVNETQVTYMAGSPTGNLNMTRAGVTAVWNFIAKFSQDEWDASFKCIFDSLDLDGDGTVSKPEQNEFIRRAVGLEDGGVQRYFERAIIHRMTSVYQADRASWEPRLRKAIETNQLSEELVKLVWSLGTTFQPGPDQLTQLGLQLEVDNTSMTTEYMQHLAYLVPVCDPAPWAEPKAPQMEKALRDGILTLEPTETLCAPAATASGDPHIMTPWGFPYDVRGLNNTNLNLHTSSDSSFSAFFECYVYTLAPEDSRSVEVLSVNGSFMTKAYIVFREDEATCVYVSYVANQLHPARVQVLAPFGDVILDDRISAQTGMLAVGAVSLELVHLSAGAVFSLVAANTHWRFTVTPGSFRLVADGSRLKRIDVAIAALTDPLAQRVLPHGLISQSYDGQTMRKGKTDSYVPDKDGVFTTTAQGEGAIQGTITDYIVQPQADVFSTVFAFSRFGKTEAAPRDGFTHLANKVQKMASYE